MTVRSPTYNINDNVIRDTSLSPMTTKPHAMMPHKQDNNNQVQMMISHHHQKQESQPAMPQHRQYNEEENKNDNREEEEQSRNCIVENDSDSISLDASSLHSFGSIRPDPNYDPARDPMNPINQFKQFVPPKEIIVKTVRGRRRNMMDRGEEVRCDEDRSRSLSPMRTPLHAVATNTTPPTTPIVKYHQQCQQQQQKQPRSNYPASLMMPSLNHQRSSEMLVSDDVFHNDLIHSTNSIVIDDDDLESNNGIDNNNAVEHRNQQQQQHNDKLRKGMVRREFSRRILALKKRAKTYSSKSKNSGDIINGKDIDRIFGEVDIQNNQISNSFTSSSTADSTNNGSDVSNKAKSPWHTSLFTNKNMFAMKQDKKILESSIVC